MGSGHFGASGRYEYLKETAFEYAFLLDVLSLNRLNMNPQPPPNQDSAHQHPRLS